MFEGTRFSLPKKAGRMTTVDINRACETMSTATLERIEEPASLSDDVRTAPLSDIVDFAAEEQLPDVPWLTRLHLDSPRRDARCLGEITCFFKRVFDIVIAAAALVMLIPVMLAVAVLVKCTSPGRTVFSANHESA